MRRREDFAITKHTLNLYAGDYAYIQAHYPARIGAARKIRELVRAHVDYLKRAPAKRAGEILR